jgi:hypothetical protein
MVPSTATAATATSVRSWSAGTLAPGTSKSYVWNNANSDIYQVNTAGIRTGTTDAPCQIAVTAQSYQRTASGARRFSFTIRNTDAVSCDVSVYLALITADRSASTGMLSPGQSKSWYWRNSDLRNQVYIAGATPNTAAAGTCQLDVAWKVRVTATGEGQFWWTVRNIGSTACDGLWQLGWLPVDETTRFPDDDPPSAVGSQRSLNSPVSEPFRVYFFGLVPNPTTAGNCDWAPTHRRQSGDPAVPTSDARTDVGYTNAGAVPCVIHAVTAAYIR